MAAVKSQMGFVTVIVAHPSDSDYNEIKNMKEAVREMMDHIEEYTDIDQCENFVRSTRYEYIFIISTSHFINNVFNLNLHQIRHVQSIFLFDPYKKINLSDIDNLRQSSYKVNKKIFFLY